MRPALRISVDSNQSIPGATGDACVHQLFEQQVRCTPHATAIIFERVLSHFQHLRQLGPKEYVRAVTRSLAARLGSETRDDAPRRHVTTEEQDFADGISASGDAVQCTEWSIYLATNVNYRPPLQRLPGRITYFLARDNQYAIEESDNRRNWKRGAAEFEVHVIPGRHNTIGTEPFVAVLPEKFITSLAKAQNRASR